MRGVMNHISVDRFLTPREMAERDEPNLRHWAHRIHAHKFRDLDDLDSVVNDAISYATIHYQVGKGTRFKTYALERIRTFVLDYFRNTMGLRRQYHLGPQIMDEITTSVKYAGERRHGRVLSLEGTDEQNGLHHVLKAPEADPIVQFHGADLSHYCRGLNDREHKIIIMSFRDGLTMKEIGMNMGLSEARISQLRGQAFTHIRARLEEDEARNQRKENE